MKPSWAAWCTAAGLCGVLGLAPAIGGAPAPAGAVLENDTLRLAVGVTGGARLTSLVARRQGRDLVRAGTRTPLYQVELRGPGGAVTLDASQADATGIDRPDAETIVVTSRHDRAGIEVVNTFRLTRSAPAAELRTEVRRKGGDDVVAILRTPGLALPLPARPGRASALVPVADGEVIGDLGAALADGETRAWNYPGMASAQLLAAYDDRGGAVLWAADGSGQFKRLCLRRSGAEILVYFEHVVAHMRGPAVTVPYAVRIGVFEGGWERAADLYRDWARGQPWCARRVEERPRPEILRGPSFFLGANVREAKGAAGAVDRSAAIPGVAASWSRALGMPVTAILLGWEKHGAWIAPDAFPPFGGDDAFAALVRGLHAGGNRAMLFLSGLNLTLEKSARNGAPAYRMPEAERARYRPAAIVDPSGAILLQGAAAGEGIGRHAVLCPATALAREVLETGLARSLALGVDVVQVDQIPGGGTPPCFATSHGHPPGGGATAYAGLAAILEGMGRAAAARRPAAALSLEEPGELFIPRVDLFHCREYMQGMWPRDGRGSTGVPLFAYLYHEYAPGYGGDSAPIAVRGEDPDLALYAQAMNLAAGRLPGAAVWMRLIPFDQVHPALAAFMKDAAGLLLGEAGRFVLEGRMIDLGIDAGRQVISGRAGGAARRFEAPEVMARGFEMADGTLGLLYINVTGAPRRVRIGFGPGRAASSAKVVWPRGGGTVRAGSDRTLAPREILFLRPEGR